MIYLLSSIFFISCNSDKQDRFSYALGGVGAMSEMVAAGVKKLALSAPMSPDDMDQFIGKAIEVADRHGVNICRERDFLTTDLFSEDITAGKDVLLIYRGATLDAYQSLKSDKAKLLEKDTYSDVARRKVARRFGRLLSYTPQKINQLLAENTGFRTMRDFGVMASNLFLYYRDLARATEFYTKVLGRELLADYGMASILRMTGDSYLILVDASKGMHSADEPKTVALALVTDQLEGWYEFMVEQGVEMKHHYRPGKSEAHDGFVAVDPEGYLLEFEMFKQHPENELFLPVLDQNAHIFSHGTVSGGLPPELGIKSTITWLYYRDIKSMQGFLEEVLGLSLVADQGWTKIYQSSTTGFIGLVDEKRGMHSFTEDKAATISFIIEDLDGWFEYVHANSSFELRSDTIGAGPEGKYRAFVGYDPEGYYLEFDRFYDHPENEKLMHYLAKQIPEDKE